ncbi:hypothetical protein [Novosphingobium naphthalenivorans]|uniref:hypothetical protein n=1 Tax=Novosphingobium naphthalenivorans TaxID=273168 RepID=UPI000A02BA49|nr:hypothetical protein [Novosphingobium naphthalenivorans]
MPLPDVPPDPPVAAQQLQDGSFDLSDLGSRGNGLSVVKPRCQPAAGNEIVVCAPDPEKNRVRPLSGAYDGEQGLPRARMDIGEGVSLDLHLDSAAMPDGTVSNRVMVGVKIAF